MQLATPPYGNLKNVINHSSLFERSLYYRTHGVMSSEILRRAPGDLLWSVHPVGIMFIQLKFTFKEKIVPCNYVSLTCQFLGDPLTGRVPITLTDPVPWIPRGPGLSMPSPTC